MQPTTAAVVKATGGAGATRTSLELAATLGRAGHAVGVLDVDFATQGLAAHVPGRIEADLTNVLVEDGSLGDASVDLDLDPLRDAGGRVAVAPSRAPFERLARAKTPRAAQTFETVLDDAAAQFDYVLVDAPPVATNPAVSAVTTADRVAAVTPASQRGVDALQRLRERLEDVGAAPGLAIANRADGEHPVQAADAALPTHEVPEAAVPSAADPDPAYAPAVAEAAEALFDVELALEFPEEGLIAGRFG
ncbi:cell division inhibitor [Salinarchaeum sp. Harcht-Bsk1]|uniref:AAA family ATPase n=1 Tax=Salinarchaeum sp. Harcht-Bsk1 TaxID=1333523 RepID=UPI0003422F33|nr:AAA family ATPase [Salinarchaeum sp. Harcht-Bsk1]AGN01748.1 cell division inhibitor [Salinarchaeum sp. Harcht-Bsk1]